jgi:PKD repeat protein
MLTITSAGTFTIGLITDATATHQAGALVTATLTVNKGTQAAPAGFTATGETAISVGDGTISGVTTAMEYKLSTAASYTACPAGTITGLAPGTYYIRLAATANYLASPDAQVTVAAFSAPPAVTVSALAPVVVDVPYSVNVLTALGITGTPTPTVTVTGLPDGLTYSGGVISGTPATPGSYPVTVTVTNAGGTVTTTVTLVVSAAPGVTPVISRQVELVVADGFLTDPTPGMSRIKSATDFYITITSPPDLTPVVTTSRDIAGDVSLTYDPATGTWQARVRRVQSDITVWVQACEPTGNADVATSDIRVWTTAGELHVVCRDVARYVPTPPTVQVYTFAGALVTTGPVPDGETVIPLPQGIYIVKAGGTVSKVTVSP